MPAETRGRSLYICYFGIREPLVQTQVLPYLRELVGARFDIWLLTFEPTPAGKWTEESEERTQHELAEQGIQWRWLPYHKRPSLPATVYDILCGARFGTRLVRQNRIDLVHGRAHVGAAIGYWIKRLTGARLLFDIRGFNPEEYVDAGIWTKSGLKFRLAKAAEKKMLQASDGFVVLTKRARTILFPGCEDRDKNGRPIAVIPTCVDLERFGQIRSTREQVRTELGLEGKDVYVYIGALGGFYLTEELAKYFDFVQRQSKQFHGLVLTQSSPSLLTGVLDSLKFPPEKITVLNVRPSDVPVYLQAADVAVSFIKSSYSKQSSSPTKIAEYLASGLPVLCNSGVGDVDAIIEGANVGVVISEFSVDELGRAAAKLSSLRQDPELADRCKRTAKDYFDLRTVGGPLYAGIYGDILGLPNREVCAELASVTK